MRQKPLLKYNGLTVILSNPSRFDKQRLLSGNGGVFFNNECLQPETNVMQCDARLLNETESLLPETKCVLLLGDAAAQKYLGTNNLLGQIRGAPYDVNGIPHIASYFPQDCVDVQDFESAAKGEATSEDELDSVDEKTHHGKTARSNFRFWLTRDVKRAINITKYGIPRLSEPPNYIICPSYETITDFLDSLKDKDVFFDIETDADLHITCFAIASADSPVFTVPLLDHTYRPYYVDTAMLLAKLTQCISRNTLVAHNGAAFDFLVLPLRYGIPLGRCLYDTMIAHHRCYPLVEKSLGHCVSLWTYEPFHKDESDFSYNSPESCHRLWSYCGKDVHTMRLVKRSIDTFAKTIPGLENSIQDAMDSIHPYITMMLQGIHYKQIIRDEIVKENDRLMTHYSKWVPMLLGPEIAKAVAGQSKSCMLGSAAQCVRYFHDIMGYPVIARSKKTGQPALGKKQMFKLKLKHDNPMLDLCHAYRELSKESGSLKFNPWMEYMKQSPSTYVEGWPKQCNDSIQRID